MKRRRSQCAREVSALILRSAHAKAARSRVSTRFACARLEGWGRTSISSLPGLGGMKCATRAVRDGLVLRDASQRVRASGKFFPRSRCDAPQHEARRERAEVVIE